MSEPHATETAATVQSPSDKAAPAADTQSLKTIAMVSYGLMALAFLFGFTYIVAGVVSHIKSGDARDTWLESHFRWQIRTFWFSILWAVIGMVTVTFVIGGFVLLANGIWVIYRIAKGWLKLVDQKPMYT